jgi:DNA-binding PadR family transcriptional regulator
MVRLEVPKRPDASDIDTLRWVNKNKQQNYPNAIYKYLRSYYVTYGKKVDDETLRLRLERLCEDGYLEYYYENGLKRYVLTSKGTLLLKSTIVIDACSGQIDLYISRINDMPEEAPSLISISADKPAEIRCQDGLSSTYVDFGTVRRPFASQDGKASVSIKSEGFARIVAPAGWEISKFSRNRPPKN